VLAAWSQRAVHAQRRDGALVGGSVVSGRWQGAVGEITGVTGRAPGNAVGGGASGGGDGVTTL
jgi:hypothetical protein